MEETEEAGEKTHDSFYAFHEHREIFAFLWHVIPQLFLTDLRPDVSSLSLPKLFPRSGLSSDFACERGLLSGSFAMSAALKERFHPNIIYLLRADGTRMQELIHVLL